MSRINIALMCVVLALMSPTLEGTSRTAERIPQTNVTKSIALPAQQPVTLAAAPAPTNELQCLADVIYFEARGESKAGRMAVGQVAINRTNHRDYPDTICEVVYQSSPSGRVCQFSWACDPSHRVRDRQAYSDAKQLAQLLYTDFKIRRELPDIVNGATHFHNTTVQPGWASRLERTARIDDHIFYAQRSGSNYR